MYTKVYNVTKQVVLNSCANVNFIVIILQQLMLILLCAFSARLEWVKITGFRKEAPEETQMQREAIMSTQTLLVGLSNGWQQGIPKNEICTSAGTVSDSTPNHSLLLSQRSKENKMDTYISVCYLGINGYYLENIVEYFILVL